MISRQIRAHKECRDTKNKPRLCIKCRSLTFMKPLIVCVFALIVQCHAAGETPRARQRRATPCRLLSKLFSFGKWMMLTGTLGEYSGDYHDPYDRSQREAYAPTGYPVASPTVHTRDVDPFNLIQTDGLTGVVWDDALSETELKEIESAYADFNPRPEVAYDGRAQIDFKDTPYFETVEAISKTDAFQKILRTLETKIPGIEGLSREPGMMRLFKINHDPAQTESVKQSRYEQYMDPTAATEVPDQLASTRAINCHRDRRGGVDYFIHIPLDNHGENFTGGQLQINMNDSLCAKASATVSPKRGMVVVHAENVYHQVSSTVFDGIDPKSQAPRRRSLVIGVNKERNSMKTYLRKSWMVRREARRGIKPLTEGKVKEIKDKAARQKMSRREARDLREKLANDRRAQQGRIIAQARRVRDAERVHNRDVRQSQPDRRQHDYDGDYTPPGPGSTEQTRLNQPRYVPGAIEQYDLEEEVQFDTGNEPW